LLALTNRQHQINNSEDYLRQSQIFWVSFYAGWQESCILVPKSKPQDLGFFNFSLDLRLMCALEVRLQSGLPLKLQGTI
jgi:hypothetical protein